MTAVGLNRPTSLRAARPLLPSADFVAGQVAATPGRPRLSVACLASPSSVKCSRWRLISAVALSASLILSRSERSSVLMHAPMVGEGHSAPLGGELVGVLSPRFARWSGANSLARLMRSGVVGAGRQSRPLALKIATSACAACNPFVVSTQRDWHQGHHQRAKGRRWFGGHEFDPCRERKGPARIKTRR
jgi:hypothetical protein